MNYEEKIQHLMKLQTKKDKLEKELSIIKNEIRKMGDSCSHIFVYLYHFDFQDTKNNCRCLMCGKIEETLYYEPEFVIHAEDYLPQYDTCNEDECNEKLLAIQTLALGFLKFNPNMTREELTLKMNDLIQESISTRKNQDISKMVKKM